MNKALIGLLSLLALLCPACGQAGSNKNEVTQYHTQAAPAGHEQNTRKGELVPSDEVCMVNDTYWVKNSLM